MLITSQNYVYANVTKTNKENEEHNDSAGEDFDHNFDFTVSLDDEYINNIEKKEK